jgi:hypothetical protein
MRVRFHLPDFSGNFKLNLMFAEMLKNRPEFFREGVEIASFYGVFPPSIWNGGRTQGGVCDKNFVRSVIKAFNDRGIPLRFTFTNPALEKKHLSDDFCNMVMNLANNGLNEAIVMSPLLEEYIRRTYPKYKLTSSTCKRITDPEALKQELEKDYSIVVVDYDFNNNFEVLEKLPRKQDCELLVNACCNPGCKLRSEHYRVIGAEQFAYAEHLRKFPDRDFDFTKIPKYAEYQNDAIFNCQCMNRTIFQSSKLANHITPEAIWERYIPMGFEQFKIEGRTIDIFNLIEHYMYYMIKPECRDEARLRLYIQLAKRGVIKTQF